MYYLNVMSLAVLLVALVSVVTSHSCECENKDKQHHMMQCEHHEYCCGEKESDWHCCDKNEKSGHHRHALMIGLGCAGLLVLVVSSCVCVCCYRYKKRKARDAKVLPSSITSPVIAIVPGAGAGYSKEKEAYGLSGNTSYPPLDFQTPPSYSQIDLRPSAPTDAQTPCPPYGAPIVP